MSAVCITRMLDPVQASRRARPGVTAQEVSVMYYGHFDEQAVATVPEWRVLSVVSYATPIY
jgi:hypothetical protein